MIFLRMHFHKYFISGSSHMSLFSQNFPPPMIGKNFKTFQTFSSTKIIVENIACLELFLMSFLKYPISNV